MLGASIESRFSTLGAKDMPADMRPCHAISKPVRIATPRRLHGRLRQRRIAGFASAA
jgi:hypothetical protein